MNGCKYGQFTLVLPLRIILRAKNSRSADVLIRLSMLANMTYDYHDNDEEDDNDEDDNDHDDDINVKEEGKDEDKLIDIDSDGSIYKNITKYT